MILLESVLIMKGAIKPPTSAVTANSFLLYRTETADMKIVVTHKITNAIV